ncbi:hypothetical protein [Pseudonocardia xishanensis]|uniref:hypothetical protein n=1 Tax=Pseudonocardia xishanensis TaxID=630995 RepID=UPI0031EFDD91
MSTATIDVVDGITEEVFSTVAEAQVADMDRAAGCPLGLRRRAWPGLSHHRGHLWQPHKRVVAARRTRENVAGRVARSSCGLHQPSQ